MKDKMSVEILSKNCYVDPDTLCPVIKLNTNIIFNSELMKDADACGNLDDIAKKIGYSIINAMKEIVI